MERDFYGFSFDGVHSSELNILRVSDGDRYNEGLHPEFENKLTQVGGLNGEYYWGRNFASKPIEISIAYDSVTEEQFRNIWYIYSTKKLCPLIFDERPYKMYTAKTSDPVQLEYICFDEEEVIADTQARDGVRRIHENGTSTPEQVYPYIHTGNKRRIYKGEGTINFICPFPFARAPFKTLDQYRETRSVYGNVFKAYENVDEWANSSGILTKEVYDNNNIDRPYVLDNGRIQFNLYNPGDIDSPFYLYIPFDHNGKINGTNGENLIIDLHSDIMIIEPLEKKGNDSGIVINTANHLIEGVDFDNANSLQNTFFKAPWSLTGNLYNEYLIKGDFPKIIHNGPRILLSSGKKPLRELRTNWDNTAVDPVENVEDESGEEVTIQPIERMKIFYDYLYY